MTECTPFVPKPPPPKPQVYVCYCGCEGFWLYRDGRVECHECNTFHDDMTGYGQPEGRDEEFWHQAEREIAAEIHQERNPNV